MVINGFNSIGMDIKIYNEWKEIDKMWTIQGYYRILVPHQIVLKQYALDSNSWKYVVLIIHFGTTWAAVKAVMWKIQDGQTLINKGSKIVESYNIVSK